MKYIVNIFISESLELLIIIYYCFLNSMESLLKRKKEHLYRAFCQINSVARIRWFPV